MKNRENLVLNFEKAFAQHLGVKYAVAVSNSTAAIHAALYAAGVSHKDEVILSPLAHPELAHAIRYLDAVPMYTDIDPKTGCLDPEAVRWRISSKTKVIIATHYAGFPCEMDALAKLIEGREIVVVEDASQALGGKYKGKTIGRISPLTVFDFSHEQGVYTELGGMVVTDSEEYYNWLKLFRDTGLMMDKDGLVKEEGPWYYEAQEIGFNYRMTSMQAEMGLRALRSDKQKQKRRSEIAAIYEQELAGLAGIELLMPCEESVAARYSVPIILKDSELVRRRREFVEVLLTMGIAVKVQYYPIYLHPIYLWQGHPDVCTIDGPLCPMAEDFYAKVLNLPVNPDDDDITVKGFAQGLKTAIIKNL